jgi:hypothetical protein
MPFWVILINIAKIILKVRKYLNLLKGLSSGKLIQSLVSDFVIGQVRDGLVQAGVPVGTFKFVEQARNCLEQVLDATTKDLAKSRLRRGPQDCATGHPSPPGALGLTASDSFCRDRPALTCATSLSLARKLTQ